jgi:putative transcriptional regulator
MTIRHHLSDPLMLAYAAGHLPEAFSLVAATHLSLCDECRAQAGAFESVGGALLDAGGGIPMDAQAVDRALARIDGPPQAARPVAQAEGIFPAPLAGYVGGDLAAVRWRRVGGGVRQAILPTGKGAVARLVLIPAGKAVPDHGHRGLELTLVLQGAFADTAGRYDRGDVEISDDAVVHTPTALAGQDCICLTASEAPLRFRGLVPRMAQRLLGI